MCRWSLQFSDEARNLSTRAMCSRVATSLDILLTTRSKFIDDPLHHSDLSQLLRICEHWTLLCLTEEQRAMATTSLSNDLLNLWTINDLLLNSSLTFMQSREFFRYGNCQNYQLCYFVQRQNYYVGFKRFKSISVSDTVDKNVDNFCVACI